MFANRKYLMTSCAAAAALLCGAPGAGAVAQQPAAAPQEKRIGMFAVGFDAAVAAAHGYRIVTYPNGDQQSVPVDPGSKLTKSVLVRADEIRATSVRSAPRPDRLPAPLTSATTRDTVASNTDHASNTDYNEVWGNCGQAWIRVSETGDSKVSVASGFRYTPEPAYFWSWDVSLSDTNGTSHQTHAGAASGNSASRIWTNLNQYAWTYDYVHSGAAALDDGTICFAGHPDVSINL